jgi:hypothetical protein
LFAFGGQLLVDLDGLFGHGVVGFLRAADEGEIGAGGQTFMAIGVKTDSENNCLLIPFFSHYRKINALSGSSSGKKLPAGAQAIFWPPLFSQKRLSF